MRIHFPPVPLAWSLIFSFGLCSFGLCSAVGKNRSPRLIQTSGKAQTMFKLLIRRPFSRPSSTRARNSRALLRKRTFEIALK